MTVNDIIQKLEENQNPKGIANWEKTGPHTLSSFGMGLGQIKKLAKELKIKDKDLALEVWKEPILDAKQMACLIGEPKKMNEDELTKMALEAGSWMTTHTFVQNVLCKSPMASKLSDEWRESQDDQLRTCGYHVLYYLVKDKKLDDAYFEELIPIIEQKLQNESNFVKDGMNSALFAIGQRSKTLHEKALPAAKNIGKVMVDYGDNSCEAVDLVKHLSSERVMKKWG